MSEAQIAQSAAVELSTAPLLPPLQQRRFEAMLQRTERRNFRLGVWNGILYNLGQYFMSRSTIIPMFLSTLTTSSALIGIVSQFDSIGWYLPQLFFSTYMVHRQQKMPLYWISTAIRTVSYFALAVLALTNPSPSWLLVFFILAYGLYHFSAGMGGVVFMELLAKAIPAHRRARFLGIRMSVGALVAATLGASSITALLASDTFPTNFGYVFLVGAVIASTGLFLMSIMREPRTKSVPPRRTFLEQLRIAYAIIRNDDHFRHFLTSRLILNTWTIGLPFIILFGRDKLGFDVKDTGIFIAAECVGLILSNYLWEKLELRRGPKSVLLASCIVGMLVPALLLSIYSLGLPAYSFAIVFALTAAWDAAVTIGGLGYLIEMTNEHDRSTYVGIFNSSMALPCFLTAGAGVLLDLLGYETLYLLVFALAGASVIAVRRLRDIRLAVR